MGPEFSPFALIAFITAYTLAPDFGFPVPIYRGVCIIYHGIYAGIHNLLFPALIISAVRLYQCTLYMDRLDAMPLCDTNIAGMESVGRKDQGGEL